MCVPGCQDALKRGLSRRRLLQGAGVAAAAASVPAAWPARARAQGSGFTRAVDLTHTIVPDFPTFFGAPQFEAEELFNFEEHSFHSSRWHLDEHTGTHMDAPFHFAPDGIGPAEMPVEDLVVPLAVIDVRAEAAENADYELTPEDIADWEAEHGPLPDGCCVAMNSGWERHLDSDMFRNVDDDGVMHFPGFHAEATDLLMTDRAATGIAVDTLSLDFGASQDFAVHFSWLPSGRWGIETIANLDGVPATGATLIVGAPKIAGATGGPCRLIALV